MLLDLNNFSLNTTYTFFLAKLAQKFCLKTCVKMIGVVEFWIFGERKFMGLGGLQLKVYIVDGTIITTSFSGQPIMMKVPHPGGLPERAKWVDIPVALAGPVFKGNTQLDTSHSCT